jgi:ABC-2 type transport system ATP-binding protein
VIEVRGLTRVYRVAEKDPGFVGSLRSLVSRRYKDVRAVNDVTFDVAAGERVGFLGPNGAGKTTTLKMLSGLLHPTSGTARVNGFTPQDRARPFLLGITLVMGNKQQLLWDLPATETFALNAALYGLDARTYAESRDELVELLGLAEFMGRPVRNLSLGQRMRCELAAALLHRPKVLFLDEPTIGLDVEVQATVRRFIAAYNQRHGATVMLTSHDMHDVAAIAKRILLIDQGVVKFDGPIGSFTERFGQGRRVTVRSTSLDLSAHGFARDDDGAFTRTVPGSDVNALLAAVLRDDDQADVTVADPPLEEVLRRAFSDAGAPAA